MPKTSSKLNTAGVANASKNMVNTVEKTKEYFLIFNRFILKTFQFCL